jgi:Fur family transcriptional regulator, stress-responsive regulator
MPADNPTPSDADAGAVLRARGLRVTPQRRAILGAFTGASTEHLSADEVHARASAVVPELSRGTVYATLAELTELQLLAAFGSPEPVRYETNATDHEHFRCRICLRLYDVALPPPATVPLTAQGFVVERSTTTVEGICADCVQYDDGLREGAQRATDGPDAGGGLPDGLAATELESPLGPLLLGATAHGLVRLVFDDHVDAPALRELIRRRRGGQAARAHLADARAQVTAYFDDTPPPPACAIDWDAVDNVSVPTLQAVQTIGAGLDRSYETLRGGASAHDQGLSLGTNPLALLVPCHRVTRGREITDAYVGGLERKRLLRVHEQQR